MRVRADWRMSTGNQLPLSTELDLLFSGPVNFIIFSGPLHFILDTGFDVFEN